MRRFALAAILTVLVFAGCGDGPPAPDMTGPVKPLLQQGPVCAWVIPVTREGAGTLVGRYIVTGEEKPREYPVEGDFLTLTTIDQDGVLTIVHGHGAGPISSSVTFQVAHPLPGDVRVDFPRVISAGRESQSVWKKTWESPETREEVFSVELVVYLKPAAP